MVNKCCQSNRLAKSNWFSRIFTVMYCKGYLYGISLLELSIRQYLPLCLSQVYVDIPGGLNLSLSLPLVIGTIPLHAFPNRTSSISSYCSSISWPERPEGTTYYCVWSVCTVCLCVLPC